MGCIWIWIWKYRFILEWRWFFWPLLFYWSFHLFENSYHYCKDPIPGLNLRKPHRNPPSVYLHSMDSWISLQLDTLLWECWRDFIVPVQGNQMLNSLLPRLYSYFSILLVFVFFYWIWFLPCLIDLIWAQWRCSFQRIVWFWGRKNSWASWDDNVDRWVGSNQTNSVHLWIICTDLVFHRFWFQ